MIISKGINGISKRQSWRNLFTPNEQMLETNGCKFQQLAKYTYKANINLNYYCWHLCVSVSVWITYHCCWNTCKNILWQIHAGFGFWGCPLETWLRHLKWCHSTAPKNDAFKNEIFVCLVSFISCVFFFLHFAAVFFHFIRQRGGIGGVTVCISVYYSIVVIN